MSRDIGEKAGGLNIIAMTNVFKKCNRPENDAIKRKNPPSKTAGYNQNGGEEEI